MSDTGWLPPVPSNSTQPAAPEPSEAARAEASGQWPDPVPFLTRSAPAFPADLLPGFLGDMVDTVARATETPVELATLLGLSPIPPRTEDAYGCGIERLLRLSPPLGACGTWQPWRLGFSPLAYQAWKEFQRYIETLMREGAKLHSVKDWASKLPGAAVRMSGVFHCVVCDPATSSMIERDTIDQALNLATLLIDHALPVFNLMDRDPTIEDGLKILGWIRREERRSFTVRECFCAHQSRFKKVENMYASLHLLEEHLYVRQGPKEKVSYRPSEVWEVNPRALETGL